MGTVGQEHCMYIGQQGDRRLTCRLGIEKLFFLVRKL